MPETHTALLSEASTALLDLAPTVPRLATCPLCHTIHPSLTATALEADGNWQCSRCGQRWNAIRVANHAAYAAWVVAHDASR